MFPINSFKLRSKKGSVCMITKTVLSSRIAVLVISYVMLAVTGFLFLGVFRIFPFSFMGSHTWSIGELVFSHILFANYAASCYISVWFIYRDENKKFKILLYSLSTFLVITMYFLALAVSEKVYI